MNAFEHRAQSVKAAHFRDLHFGSRILILPNAWDVASAKIFEQMGFKAVATTSAGVAASRGYADGQNIPKSDMLDVVRRIADGVEVPVTADMEAGFGDTVEQIVDTVSKVISAGAVGLNLEDKRGNKMMDASFQVEAIKAAKEVGVLARVPIVINARTDIYSLGIGEPNGRFRLTVERAIAYREAGADCIFVPGLSDAKTIKLLVKELQCPVNILAGSETPRINELHRIGVARVSMGSGPLRATLALLERISQEIQTKGTFRAITEQSISFSKLQKMFSANAGNVISTEL